MVAELETTLIPTIGCTFLVGGIITPLGVDADWPHTHLVRPSS
jgi:hypothetical protein